ncbi:SMP-30/gluconolactonase/LRE family protein [Acuticoccus sp.]|uniref:SMP-30/gluconolactonase/LRE family protein n=1 Tax=Acuticoccus sp. TaxID=1904378 RepID=UPI003B51E4A1
MYHPHLEVIEREYRALILNNCALDKLWTGGRWLEGPAYFAAHRALVFSDIPNDRMLRYDEATGTVGVFREPARHANGNTRDREGRLVTCEHSGRRVTRTEHDGTITVLADRVDGKRLNSPNDVVVAPDGAVWFTDPTYGIDKDYEGARAAQELPSCDVYRIDPHTGMVRAVATDFVRPNGIAFSPDYRWLFVADTGISHVSGGPRHIRRFGVDGARLSGGEVFVECDHGVFDGFRFCERGYLWTSAGDGVRCYNGEGALVGKVRVPEVVANVAWGMRARNRLYICGTSSLYATYLATNGMAYPS